MGGERWQGPRLSLNRVHNVLCGLNVATAIETREIRHRLFLVFVLPVVVQCVLEDWSLERNSSMISSQGMGTIVDVNRICTLS